MIEYSRDPRQNFRHAQFMHSPCTIKQESNGDDVRVHAASENATRGTLNRNNSQVKPHLAVVNVVKWISGLRNKDSMMMS